MKVDTQIEDNWRRTISYLQVKGILAQSFSCKKLSNQNGEYSSQYKKNNFMLNGGKIK